jgi:hypothetical protein
LRDRNLEIEAERGEMIMEKKENRRLQQRIPKSKGRGKGKGIPGIEIIEAYRPMTTALGPRMTVSPFAPPTLPLCPPASLLISNSVLRRSVTLILPYLLHTLVNCVGWS